MDLHLLGKRALVTAASQGLGKAIATELVREGGHVVISSRSDAKLQQAVADILRDAQGQPHQVYAYTADVSVPEDVARLVQYTAETLGGLDILVTNAGGPPAGKFADISDEMWVSAVELNLLSVIRLIRGALPLMQKAGGGRILNVASSSIKQPIPNLILSNTIRTGVTAMLKTLASEVATDNIHVYTLAPGRIDTDRVKSLDAGRAQREDVNVAMIQKQEEDKIPLLRYGQPEEFGRFAAFLLSGANSYTTGQAFYVDGGLLSSL